MNGRPPIRVLVAGGGIAGLEALLALRQLAGDAVSLTLLEPRAELVLHALETAEPFGTGRAGRLPIAEVADAAGATLVRAGLERVDADGRRVYATDGHVHDYDALLVAVGARAAVGIRDAVTWIPGGDQTAFREILAGIEAGAVSRVAFVVPPRCLWSLPAYELALMVGRRFEAREPRVELFLVTPEAAPLAIFGPAGSGAVAQTLGDAGVGFLGNTIAKVRRDGGGLVVDAWPGRRRVAVDRVVTLPRALGPDIPGLRADIEGFIVTDEHCLVRGTTGVWAAGDATSRTPATGGLAARQADTAAQQIARLAGVPVPAGAYTPLLQAQLRTGRGSLWLQRDIPIRSTRGARAVCRGRRLLGRLPRAGSVPSSPNAMRPAVCSLRASADADSHP